MSDVKQIITDTRAYSCVDCGKCTVVCPVAKYDPDYSPRKFVTQVIYEQKGELLNNGKLGACITCAMCEMRCQSGVKYTELIKSLRAEAYVLGNTAECTHGGALQSFMQIMTASRLRQNRLDWVDKDLKTATESDVLYFVGCAPYFDSFFASIGAKTLPAARGAVKLLNALDIVPALMPNERCCGHDLLWGGDKENFLKLAEHNLKEIGKTKAKKVVTACAECYQTLKVEYPRHFSHIDFEVVHISELLAEPVATGKLKFRRLAKKVTYQDPCRLGRSCGVYDEPRAMLNAIPGLELAEMPRNRVNALCCGTQAWVNCGTVNKQIQAERLREASATGAGVLLTACPKCQIHLKCALHDQKLGKELPMEITDLTGLVAEALEEA